VGEWIAGRSFARVLTSPLGRASETCELARPEPRCEPHDDLLEWDYGDYDGLTTVQIRESRPDWYLWRDGCPGGESPADVGARADRVLDELRKLDGDALVFAHGHVLRVLTARWLGLGPESGALFWLDTATLSVLGYERETRVMRVWNARGSLEQAAA
jgi:broad specificity phosphatase PhoE